MLSGANAGRCFAISARVHQTQSWQATVFFYIFMDGDVVTPDSILCLFFDSTMPQWRHLNVGSQLANDDPTALSLCYAKSLLVGREGPLGQAPRVLR
ncbi:hypothetical protein ElyMa_000493000 [Elysia marginata]|uniref:Uncharacterized protein n=1 Tax=Elysia marginata TaxID=1093978 RepID=A0AAV4FTL4_9GAST|nr:hypothetical protein ElyMa_000493000 [Elysia marginata]